MRQNRSKPLKHKNNWYRRPHDRKTEPKDVLGKFKGCETIVRNNNVELAIRIFNKKVAAAGILKEIEDRKYYLKPSQAKRRKRKRAYLRRMQDQRTVNSFERRV